MKYLAVITLFTLTLTASAQSQDRASTQTQRRASASVPGVGHGPQDALIDQFRIVINNNSRLALQAPARENYVELTSDQGDKKAFVKTEGEEKFKLSASKEEEGKLKVYQVKVEKEGDLIKKLEKLVEYDNNSAESGKIKKVVKCEEGLCQTFKKNFCDKLIEKKNEISSLGIEYFRNEIYKDDCAGTLASDRATLLTHNNSTRSEFGISVPASLAQSVERPAYGETMSAANFTVAKINKDITECESIKDEFASEAPASGAPRSQPAARVSLVGNR